jgi:hypothetical protein
MKNLINLAIAFVMLLYALMFRYGYFRGKQNNKYRKTINLDEILFPGLDENLAHRVDLICFWVVLCMTMLTAINGGMSALFTSVPNVSMIFLVIAFPGVMIFRFFYICVKRKKI